MLVSPQWRKVVTVSSLTLTNLWKKEFWTNNSWNNRYLKWWNKIAVAIFCSKRPFFAKYKFHFRKMLVMDIKRAVASGKLCTSHFVNFVLEILNNTFQKMTSNPISKSAKSARFFKNFTYSHKKSNNKKQSLYYYRSQRCPKKENLSITPGS